MCWLLQPSVGNNPQLFECFEHIFEHRNGYFYSPSPWEHELTMLETVNTFLTLIADNILNIRTLRTFLCLLAALSVGKVPVDLTDTCLNLQLPACSCLTLFQMKASSDDSMLTALSFLFNYCPDVCSYSRTQTFGTPGQITCFLE